MAHHVDAHYDEEENIFLPPLRTLGFNPLLKLNDSLLAQSYIEAYDISYPEATRRIEEEVNELKQHLRNKGVYELEDIGTLRLNDEGNYIFEPCEAGILTPTLYGLSSFEMKRTEAAEPERAHRYPACGTGTSESEEAAAPTNTHASASGYAKQKDRTTVTAADDANASGRAHDKDKSGMAAQHRRRGRRHNRLSCTDTADSQQRQDTAESIRPARADDNEPDTGKCRTPPCHRNRAGQDKESHRRKGHHDTSRT